MREVVPVPPKGFRKPIPVRVKLDVVIRQDGRCAISGERLGTLDETQFDHDPALALREWNPEAGDTIPPANDARFIRAVRVEPHREKTVGDVKVIAKQRRVREREAEHRAAMARKYAGCTDCGPEGPCYMNCGPVVPAPERPKPKRKMRSKGFDKTRRRRMNGTVERRA